MDTIAVNLRVSEFDVYIGRPSKWGNPYTHLVGYKDTIHVDSVEEAVEHYEVWIREQINFDPEKYNLDELRGRVLGCYCKPGPCHGDILVKLCDDNNK